MSCLSLRGLDLCLYIFSEIISISMNDYNEALNPLPEQGQLLPVKRDKKHKHSDPNQLVRIFDKNLALICLSASSRLQRRGLDLRELQTCLQKAACWTLQ